MTRSTTAIRVKDCSHTARPTTLKQSLTFLPAFQTACRGASVPLRGPHRRLAAGGGPSGKRMAKHWANMARRRATGPRLWSSACGRQQQQSRASGAKRKYRQQKEGSLPSPPQCRAAGTAGGARSRADTRAPALLKTGSGKGSMPIWRRPTAVSRAADARRLDPRSRPRSGKSGGTPPLRKASRCFTKYLSRGRAREDEGGRRDAPQQFSLACASHDKKKL